MPRIIDLTMPLADGARGVEIEPTCRFDRDGWNASTLHLYSHCGTHMDSPKHVEAGETTIDEIPPERCIGPAWVADVSGVGSRDLITVASLGDVAERLAPGESLLLKTLWSRFAAEPKYRDALPRVSLALAEWCAAKRVKMLGVEPPSVADVRDRDEVRAVHQVLLRAGVVVIEGLTNLDRLRARKVILIALPLKVRRGDGAPARVLAIDGDGADPWRALLA
ncbi:MAG: cyclase family protein [Armatimonadetes bacterium]|nr:cyclase family protein [Armatimonadota bacterium]